MKSVNVVELTKFPEESETPLVLIEFETVGFELPAAFLQTLTVAVPLSACMDQLLIVQDPEATPYSTSRPSAPLRPDRTLRESERAMSPRPPPV